MKNVLVTGATGFIGLAVVRDLVTRLGGVVRVEDGADGGACFVVELLQAGP